MGNTFPQTPSQEQARAVPDATPRPWKAMYMHIESEAGDLICDCWEASSTSEDSCQANAELIVRAVNSFDALVEALQELYDATPKGFGNDYGLEDALRKTEAALKLARG